MMLQGVGGGMKMHGGDEGSGSGGGGGVLSRAYRQGRREGREGWGGKGERSMGGGGRREGSAFSLFS